MRNSLFHVPWTRVLTWTVLWSCGSVVVNAASALPGAADVQALPHKHTGHGSVHTRVGRPDVWFWGSGSDESVSGIEAHRSSLHGATIHYSVGAGRVLPNGTYENSGNKTLIASLKSHGYIVHSIMGCGNISALRMVFDSQEEFISDAVNGAVALGLDGINLDFEPYSAGGGRIGVTNADGMRYAKFVDALAAACHAKGLTLSLDYFSNLAIWNLGALNDTQIDTLISMDTYVQDNATMEAYTQVALGYIDPGRLGVGVCPQPSQTRKPYGPDPCGPNVWTPQMVAERLVYIATLPQFQMLNFCCTGILTEVWWDGLADFYAQLA
eukprot:m.185453 g.185453  ORF g.185453 m.185453 type:complete len:325 (-) comp16453_c0_seq1:58-1032(-)